MSLVRSFMPPALCLSLSDVIIVLLSGHNGHNTLVPCKNCNNRPSGIVRGSGTAIVPDGLKKGEPPARTLPGAERRAVALGRIED